MAEIRISKLLKQFNIGLSDIVDFLRKKGVEIDENPNAKVSDEYLPELNKQFGKDKEAMEQAALADIKVKEILEKTGRKQSAQEEEVEATDWSPIIPQEARSLRKFMTGLTDCIQGSSVTRQPAEAEGNQRQRRGPINLEEPSRRRLASKRYFSL